jgi:hypothetical protein
MLSGKFEAASAQSIPELGRRLVVRGTAAEYVGDVAPWGAGDSG